MDTSQTTATGDPMRRLFLILLLSTFAGLSLASPAAHADPPPDCGDYCTGTGGDDATVSDVSDEVDQGGEDGSSDDGTPSGGTYNGPFYQYKYVVNCMANSPDNPVDVICAGAKAGCADDEIRYRVYRREVNRAGNTVGRGLWDFQDSECRGLDDPNGVVQPQVTGPMVLEEARRTAPEPNAHVEPNGETYVNVPNNFYADADDTEHTVTLFGNAITISFQVSGVTWDFGDGGTASGNGVKNADVDQPGAVEHEYVRQGSYEVTASTSITVVFTLPDGRTVTLPDAISQTSEPVTLQVGEIQTTVNDVS